MKRCFLWAMLCASAFAQGVTIGPKATMGPKVTIASGVTITPTLVQACGNPATEVGGAGNLVQDDTCRLLKPTLVHNSLIVFVWWANGQTISSVTDGAGDTFTNIAGASCNDASQTVQGATYIALNIAGGATFVKVAYSSTTQFVQPFVLEFNNIAQSSAVDTSNCNTSGGAGATTLTAGSITPSLSNELVIQAADDDNGSSTTGFSHVAQAGCTWSWRIRMIMDVQPGALHWCVDGNTTTFNPTITSGSSIQYVSMTVALKTASSGSPSPAFSPVYIQHDNNQSESVTSVSQQFTITGNSAILAFTSGCNGFSSTDCAYPTAISTSPLITWTRIGANKITNCASGGVNDSLTFWEAHGNIAGDYTNTYTMNPRTTGGNGSTWMMFDIQGANASPIDTTIGTSGLAYSELNQTVNGPITTGYSVTASQPNNEYILSQMGLNFDSPTGVSSPSGALFLSAFYTGQLNPTHNDLNAGFDIYTPPNSTPFTTTWTIDNSSGGGAGCTALGSIGVLGS